VTKEEVIKEYRVREILEAARRVLARYGMQGTTVDRVAEEAKVAKGTIYLYFDTKDELIHAAVLEGLREMVAETMAADDPSIPPLERIRKLVLAQFRIQASNQDFLKTLIIGNSGLDIEIESEAGRDYMRVYAGHLDFMAAVLQDAIDRGAIRRIDPQFAAFMLDEMVTGSLRRRLLKLASSPLESDAEAVVELFLRGIAAIR